MYGGEEEDLSFVNGTLSTFQHLFRLWFFFFWVATCKGLVVGITRYSGGGRVCLLSISFYFGCHISYEYVLNI